MRIWPFAPRADKASTRSTPNATWVSALSAAAAVARHASSGEADLLRTVSHQLRRLRLVGGVSLLTADGKLEIRSRVLSPSVERALRRLTGREISGFRFDPSDVPVYQQALSSGEAVYTTERSAIIAGLLPARLAPLAPRVLKLLGGNQPTIVAPLISTGERLGAMNVVAAWLTPDDVAMVAALADHVAATLSQVRAREEMAAALEREQLRNQAAEAVASALDLAVVLERVIELAVEVTGADAGAISLLNADEDVMEFPYTFGLPEGMRLRPAPRGRGLAWHVVETGRAIMLDEYGDHEHALPEWSQAGLHAFMGIPLVVGDQPIGAMGLFKLRRSGAFMPDQAEVIQSIAHMAAIAVKNAGLFSEMQRLAEESQALIRTSRSISASLDLSTVLLLIAEQAKHLLQADGSRIHMLDPGSGALRCLVAVDPMAPAMLELEIQPGAGLVGAVLEQGLPFLINDPASDPRSLQVPGTPQDEPECLAMAPLIIRQKPMGVMAVRRFGTERPFAPGELDLLTAFAAHAAVAIENADLYGQIEAHAQQLEREVKERTRELALSEAKYRSVVETSLAGIFNVDAQGRLVYVNQGCADLLETSRSELLRSTLFRFWPPELRQAARRRFNARMQGIAPDRQVEEISIHTTSGAKVPALLAMSVLIDEQGLPAGATGLIFDISDRKSLEAELQSERDRLDAILANIGDAVLVTDPKGTIEYVNPAWERLNGYERAEAVGRNARLLKSEKNSTTVYADLEATIRAGKPWHGDLVNCRKDGTTYDASVTITPVVDDQEEIVSFVGVQHDISALKLLDRLKSQFVSDVSHELRTPLTNIRLYVDLLGKTQNMERATEYLETLNRESDRLAHLIDDLLSLSRLESGATPFEPRPIDLNQILRGLFDDRRALAANRGLSLEYQPDAGLPLAMGDERLLSQVFTNLLTNAMNYTPGGGLISLRTELRYLAQQPWVTATVGDSGMGISADEQPMIFRRFFRGKASQATGAPGTGLGLAICRQIAEIHGGRITLQSQAGRGTEFTLWLPLAETYSLEELPGAPPSHLSKTS